MCLILIKLTRKTAVLSPRMDKMKMTRPKMKTINNSNINPNIKRKFLRSSRIKILIADMIKIRFTKMASMANLTYFTSN